MKKIALYVENKSMVLSENVHIADNPWTRFRGLMGKASIPADYCLWIEPCKQIHMMNMRFAIDVIYIDKTGKVVRVDRGLKPWSIGPIVNKARGVIECNAGFADQIDVNDVLVIR